MSLSQTLMHSSNDGFTIDATISDEQLETISKMIYRHAGIVLGKSKRDMIQSRLQKRLRARNIASISEYMQRLESDALANELPEFINALTTNLTSFFREMHHFEHIKTHVIKPAIAQHRKLRIWSCGCSVGAEPYSLAMVLAESLENQTPIDAKILATDVDSNVLKTAASGEYAADWVEKIPEHFKHKYTRTSSHPEKLIMQPDIKKYITFKQLNLHSNWPMKGKFDAILCRNVLIYFDKPTQKQCFERFANQLVDGGILYIGHSETIHNLSQRFESIGRTTYRKVR